jgi:hypothetical protein
MYLVWAKCMLLTPHCRRVERGVCVGSSIGKVYGLTPQNRRVPGGVYVGSSIDKV